MARAEIILIQFDIAGHSKIDIAPSNLQQARRLLQKYISSLVSVHRPDTVSWAGDGGWCWFKVGEASDFAIAADAAVDILSMACRINEILMRDNVIRDPLGLRLSADSMNVELDNDPSHFCAPQMNAFLKYERNIGLINSLVVTQRIFQHLQEAFRKRFDRWRYSPELETDLLVYDGVSIRDNALKRLKNWAPNHEELCKQSLKVTTFRGDRYQDLCNDAYADLGFDVDIANVATIPFMVFRNALANCVLDCAWQPDILRYVDSLKCEEDFRLAVAEAPYEALAYVMERSFQTYHPHDSDVEVERTCNPLHAVRRALEWCNGELTYDGGDDVHFFNSAALGFVAEIGECTLLDHAIGDSLIIRSVVGGVASPDEHDALEQLES